MSKRKTHEEFVEEVYEVFGDEVTVLSRYRWSKGRVGVRCNLCGECYATGAGTLLGGSRHRLCDGAFKRKLEEYRGGEFTALERFKGMSVNILVRHNVCGKEFRPRPGSLIYQNTNCPHCAELHRPTNEEFHARVAEVSNGEYEFLADYITARTKLPIRHIPCGYEYEVSPGAFFNDRGCANCSVSKGEEKIADFLSSKGFAYYREKIFDQLPRKRFDFYLPEHNIVIEYDGQQHFEPIEYWGGEEALKQTQESDAIKTAFCADQGIPLLRIPYWEFDNVEQIVQDFVESVKQPQPTA